MNTDEPDTDVLLARAEAGDVSARGRLLDRQRGRLKLMLGVRIDPRLAPRVDASDLVQETLVEAHRRLDDYLAGRPVPFYPWIRQIALDRLADVHRRHIHAERRAVGRELRFPPLPDASAAQLAKCFVGKSGSPSAGLRREDDRRRVRSALAQLAELDREILVLRYLEQMTPRDISAVLDLNEAAVSKRHLRALERLRRLLREHDDKG